MSLLQQESHALGGHASQVLMASYVEDRIQRSFYMVRMSAPPPAPLEGSPEAIGKADYLETVIQDITSMLGITSGLWQARVLADWLHASFAMLFLHKTFIYSACRHSVQCLSCLSVAVCLYVCLLCCTLWSSGAIGHSLP